MGRLQSGLFINPYRRGWMCRPVSRDGGNAVAIAAFLCCAPLGIVLKVVVMLAIFASCAVGVESKCYLYAVVQLITILC